MSEDQEEDRSDADRRGPDRRRFRSDPGRRDTSRPRRKQDRPRSRLSRLLLMMLVVAVLGLAYRALSVAPARSARAETAEVARLVDPVLRAIGLPLAAVPGFGPPVEGDPALSPTLTTEQRRVLREAADRLAVASDAARGEPGPYAMQAPILLALGDERAARIAWQQLLALGTDEQASGARVGIAALQIRAALRAPDEQDRFFALEAALHTLEPVTRDYANWPHRLVQEGLAQLALGHEDAADGVLAELTNATGPVRDAALPLLRSRRSGEEPVSATLTGLVDPPSGPE